MKLHLIYSAVIVAVAVASVIYGIAVVRYRLFPYPIFKSVFSYIKEKKNGDTLHGPWSIGIYEGSSPFDLRPAAGVRNPVLSAKDVTDMQARFVADPFLAKDDGRYFMFFEVLERTNQRGAIAYAESPDGRHWTYRKVILEEEFHLSYPYVFEWDGDRYLIPESFEDLSVRLYKATTFPDQWQPVGTLLSGYRFVDPSIFRFRDHWWLLVSTIDNDVLNLYHSDNLTGEWKAHPMNPVVRLDKHVARPAGRIVSLEDRLYRFAQDCEPEYGKQVFAFEIVELTTTTYREKAVSDRPLLTGTGTGWNAAGMHQIDLLETGDGWLAAVDGRDR